MEFSGAEENKAKVYLEPIVFHYNSRPEEEGILSRLIFNKARQGKIEIITSVWTISQYIGAIHELLVKREIEQPEHTTYLV